MGAPDFAKLPHIGEALRRKEDYRFLTGAGQYTDDITQANQTYCVFVRSPHAHANIKSIDTSKAKAMPGVVDVVQIPDGVAVVASSYWAAVKARRALKIEWDNGAGAAVSSASMLQGTLDAAKNGKVIAVQPPVGDAKSAISSAAKQVSATYVTPLLSHSPLEPMNFTAHVTAGKALLIGGTQFQQGAQGAVAGALGFKPEDVTLQTTFLGGGFGRRLELDFIVQAAQISKAVNKPVKLLWTREDDMTHDYYRPVGVNQLKAGLDASGKPVALHFKVASQSVTQRAFGLPKDTMDPFMAEAAVAGYNIANTQHDMVIHDTGIRVGYWRAVSHNMNAFANESFMDELAKAAGKDPYEYRMSLLAGKPRFANVLKLAADKAGWGKPLAKGRALGIALMEGYDTYMAQVAEVSLNDSGEVQVHRVTVAADMGHMVNPDTVEAQLQSSIIFGMGAALKHQITMTAGRVQETNYHNFQPVRMNEVPKIDIVLVKSTEKPGGIGEPATAVVAPAIANAVAKLTGKRVRRLPITAEALKQTALA